MLTEMLPNGGGKSFNITAGVVYGYFYRGLIFCSCYVRFGLSI